VWALLKMRGFLHADRGGKKKKKELLPTVSIFVLGITKVLFSFLFLSLMEKERMGKRTSFSKVVLGYVTEWDQKEKQLEMGTWDSCFRPYEYMCVWTFDPQQCYSSSSCSCSCLCLCLELKSWMHQTTQHNTTVVCECVHGDWNRMVSKSLHLSIYLFLFLYLLFSFNLEGSKVGSGRIIGGFHSPIYS